MPSAAPRRSGQGVLGLARAGDVALQRERLGPLQGSERAGDKVKDFRQRAAD